MSQEINNEDILFIMSCELNHVWNRMGMTPINITKYIERGQTTKDVVDKMISLGLDMEDLVVEEVMDQRYKRDYFNEETFIYVSQRVKNFDKFVTNNKRNLIKNNEDISNIVGIISGY